MSYSTIYADSLKPYENGQNIANNIQKKVENVAANEVLFGNVDYSGGYDTVLSNFESSKGASGSDGAGAAGGAGASGGADSPEATTPGDKIFGTNTCTDGKDDGKIGFWEGCKSFFKGIGKTVVNTVVGIVTDPKKLLLTAGAVALSIVFPPAGVAMAVVGGVAGVAKAGKGIIAATQAKTDAEKKNALEDVGGGTFQAGVSYFGAKAGLKAMKGTSGSAMSQVSKGDGIMANVRAFGKDVVTGGKGSQYTSLREAGSLWTHADGTGYLGTRMVGNLAGNIRNQKAMGQGTVKSVLKGTQDSLKDANTKIKEANIQRQANKDIKNAKEKLDKLEKRQAEARSNGAAKDSPEMKQLNKQIKQAKAELKQAKGQTQPKLDEAQTKVNDLNKKVADLENKLKTANNADKTQIQNELSAAKNQLKAANKEVANQQVRLDARQAAADKYIQYQKDLSAAKKAFNDAQEAYKTSPSEAAKTAVADAQKALEAVQDSAPQTNILVQGYKAANKQADAAGYQGARPFLSATLGPIAYEMEDN